jgi:hypothetical protein
MHVDYIVGIKQFLSTNKYRFINIDNEDSIKNIYELVINDVIFEPTTAMEMLYTGVYHEYKKDYDTMKKYYLMAVENGNISAMKNLGNYYNNIEKEYDLMKKYYLMAIENGNVRAMYHLGVYYYTVENDHKQSKKYL